MNHGVLAFILVGAILWVPAAVGVCLVIGKAIKMRGR
jgi:hypothetical protein